MGFEIYDLHSTVGVLTRPWAGRSMNRVSITVRRRGSSLLRNVRTGCKLNPASYSFGIRVSFSGGKTVGEWNWPITPSSFEVMNEWSYTTTPLCTFVTCTEATSSLLYHIAVLSKLRKCDPNQNWVKLSSEKGFSYYRLTQKFSK